MKTKLYDIIDTLTSRFRGRRCINLQLKTTDNKNASTSRLKLIKRDASTSRLEIIEKNKSKDAPTFRLKKKRYAPTSRSRLMVSQLPLLLLLETLMVDQTSHQQSGLFGADIRVNLSTRAVDETGRKRILSRCRLDLVRQIEMIYRGCGWLHLEKTSIVNLRFVPTCQKGTFKNVFATKSAF